MDESMEKYSASPMFQSTSSMSPSTTTFDNSDYTISYSGNNSPVSNTTAITMTIVDGRFFKLIPEKCINNTTAATCVKCEPDAVLIKGSVNSSSNFLCHLKRKHGPEAVAEYTEYLHSKKRFRRNPSSTSNTQSYSHLNASTDNTSHRTRAQKTQISFQDKLEMNILKFIIHSVLPVETVTNSHFLNIFKSLKIPGDELKIFNTELLDEKLVDLFHKTSQQLKSDLNDAYVCCVIDICQWEDSTCLVIMAHWVDNEMERRSAVLKIKKFSTLNECRSESIEQIFKDVSEEFNIKKFRVFSSAMFGRCNLLKAIHSYGIGKNLIEIDNHAEGIQEQIIQKYEPLSILNPRHMHCYVQELTNLASLDISNYISNNSTLSEEHGRIMQKFNELWSHPDAAVVLEELSLNTLKKISTKNWISVYFVLEEFLEMADKSDSIFQALEIKGWLSDMDFLYVQEHLQCTKPIAEALTLLDSRKHSLFGSLLPTLLALRRHLNKLAHKSWEHVCSCLFSEALLNMVEEKFSRFYKFESSEAVEAAIAAFSHPEFKNRWLSCVDVSVQNKMLDAFKAAVEEELPKTKAQLEDATEWEEQVQSSKYQSRSDFFDFGSENEVVKPMSTKAVVEMQVLNYFNYTSKDMNSLKHFPEINKVFMKYNAPLSSFSVVNKIFEGDLLQKVFLSGNKVFDKFFDMKIWLKANEELF